MSPIAPVPMPEINVTLFDPELTVTRSGPEPAGELPNQQRGRIRAYGKDRRVLVVEEPVADSLKEQDLIRAAVGNKEVGHAV